MKVRARPEKQKRARHTYEIANNKQQITNA
jgi:hypothetical protein